MCVCAQQIPSLPTAFSLSIPGSRLLPLQPPVQRTSSRIFFLIMATVRSVWTNSAIRRQPSCRCRGSRGAGTWQQRPGGLCQLWDSKTVDVGVNKKLTRRHAVVFQNRAKTQATHCSRSRPWSLELCPPPPRHDVLERPSFGPGRLQGVTGRRDQRRGAPCVIAYARAHEHTPCDVRNQPMDRHPAQFLTGFLLMASGSC